jgi:hypothetical protein
MGSCDHGNEPSGCKKGRKNAEQLSDYQLLNKDAAPCTQFRVFYNRSTGVGTVRPTFSKWQHTN